MSKLSVVICVYNTDEKYFEQCLKSVFDSTMNDLEVIVVDDGSNKDYSKTLKKFPKVKYFKTENQGTLKARIFGARKATGSHICFVDSDDTVSFCYFEAGIKKAEKSNSDIVVNDWAFHTEKTKIHWQEPSSKNQRYRCKKLPFSETLLSYSLCPVLQGRFLRRKRKWHGRVSPLLWQQREWHIKN